MPLMHDDMAPILRSYTNETIARGKKGHKAKQSATTEEAGDDMSKSLANASEEELLRELARRKAEKFATSQQCEKRPADNLPPDPTNQVCSASGENGSIRCYELME